MLAKTNENQGVQRRESEQRKNAIRGAYHLTGANNFYDGMITCSTFSGKAVCRMVWAMNRQECEDYLSKALSGIPEDFAGKMLEVPVGTGILTMPVYQTLPKADVTCLDYSPDMMGQAKEKAEKLHLTNVKFRQGDVGVERPHGVPVHVPLLRRCEYQPHRAEEQQAH